MPDLSLLSPEDLNALADKNIDAMSESGRQIAFGDLISAGQEQPQSDITEAPEIDASAAEQFGYSFAASDSDMSNAYRYVKARFGLGDFGYSSRSGVTYTPAEQAYGPAYANAPTEVKLGVLQKIEDQELARDYPKFAGQEGIGGFSGFMGTLVGSLMSPTTLIPIAKAGTGYKALAAGGAAFGAEYNALEQLAEAGKVDLTEVAISTGVGAIATPALAKGLRVLGSAAKTSLYGRKSAKSQQEATEQSYAMQDIINKHVAENGVTSTDDLSAIIQREMNLTPEQYADIQIKSNFSPKIPNTRAEAAAPIKDQISSVNPATSKGLFQGVRDFAGIVSTEVSRINPAVGGRLKRMEASLAVKSSQSIARVDPMIKMLDKLEGQAEIDVTRHLLSGDIEAALPILLKVEPKAKAIVREMQLVLKELDDGLQAFGRTHSGDVDNYFPRKTIDYKKVLEAAGREYREPIERELARRVKKLKVNSVDDLPIEEVEDAMTVGLKQQFQKNPLSKSKSSSKRQYMTVTEEMVPLYKKPQNSLVEHINDMASLIEKKSFFGGSSVNRGVKTLDLDESATRLLAREIKEKRMSTKDFDKMKELLVARFGVGEKQASTASTVAKNLTYQMTIANPLSALTQIADVGMSVYANGLINTIKGLVGKKHFTMDMFGLDKAMYAELGTVGKMAGLLDWTFRKSGFKLIDRIGKETIVNASYRSFIKKSKTVPGVEALRKKFGNMLGKDFNSTMADLKAGNISENVKVMMFSELSNYQPISLSELPLKYLQHPNGRIFYALKSFTIKQLDVLRRDVVHEFQSGNKAEATKKLVAYITILPLMGAGVQEVKDFISRGDDIDIEDIPDQYISKLYQLFGTSRYITENFTKKGELTPALGELFLPPIGLIDAFSKDLTKTVSGEITAKDSELLGHVPLFGKMVQDTLLGARDDKRIKDILDK